MAVSLYTSRIVLRSLGVEDFGIQNVVGGLVSLFNLLSGCINTTISRFLTFELGSGDKRKLENVFSTSINIQVFFIILTLIIAETIGLWFLNAKMVIPESRIYAANWVYQCSLLSFCIAFLNLPYSSLIIAHEKMSFYAYMSIFDVLLKLSIVYLLMISPWDKLIFYSVLLSSTSILSFCIYRYYCRKNYHESRYKFVYDKDAIKEMGKFAGWNYLGGSAFLLRGQGLNILLNIFFGVSINAARGIATQVENAVVRFVSNFTVALNPQIVKSYARDDRAYLYQLIFRGARYTYFLLFLLILPIIIEAPYILKLWLGEYPPSTVLFVRLTLIVVLIDSLCETLTMAILATGNVKKLQIMAGAVVLPVLPIAYVFYINNAPAYTCYILCAFALLLKFVFELILAKQIIGISIGEYVRNVLSRIVVVTMMSSIIPSIILLCMEYSFARLILSIILSEIVLVIAIYISGTTMEERSFVKSKCRDYLFFLKR